MRILALDIGEQRIGVAISDTQGLIAQNLKTLPRQDNPLTALEEIVEAYQITHFVIGLPLDMEGNEGAQAQKVRKFTEKVQKRFRKRATVSFWDERFSTVAAERTLLEADLSRQKRKKVIDQMAASFILQGYLNAQQQT